MDLDSGTPSMDLFRPSKRKKIYRKRADADEDADADDVDIPSHASTIAAVPPPEPAAVDEPIADMSSPHIPSSEQDPPSIQDILRQRKAAQRRKAGIEFTNTSTNILGHQSASTALIKSDKEAGEDSVSLEIERLVSRFAPQTGHVAEANDKHMTDYIDAELTRLHQKQRQQQASSHDPYDDSTTFDFDAPLCTNTALPEGRQPAALGRIHEIDLGPDSKARTAALTEAARHRLQLLREGHDPEALDAAESQKPPRLRRDGKPFRRRKRRNSSDVKRDKLVEEVLRESRLDIYDDDQQKGTSSNKPHRARKHHQHQHQRPQQQGSTGNNDPTRSPPPRSNSSGSGSGSDEDDEAADDALAEQFRRDFLEQVAARRRQRQRGPPPGSAKARAQQQEKQRRKLDGTASSRGPKLGGSRSARAKVRERQLEEKAAAKRPGR